MNVVYALIAATYFDISLGLSQLARRIEATALSTSTCCGVGGETRISVSTGSSVVKSAGIESSLR